MDTRNAKGFNMIIKCKMCSRENTIDIVEDSLIGYTEDSAGNFQTIAHFECKRSKNQEKFTFHFHLTDIFPIKNILFFVGRGIEPIAFDPREGFVVKSAEDGETFEDVAIEDGKLNSQVLLFL